MHCLGVTDFDRMNVLEARLGINHHNSPGRLSRPLGGNKRGPQLPLASATFRVIVGVISQKRLRIQQALFDRERDARKITDAILREPYRQPFVAEHCHKGPDTVDVRPGKADENIVFCGHLRRLQ